MQEIWEQVKVDLKEKISPSGFQLWVEPLEVEPGPEGELVLSCPNPFALRWIQAHYLALIRQALLTLSFENFPVHLQVTSEGRRPPTLPAPMQTPLPFPHEGRSAARLNRAFTFDQFVVGSSNCLAYQASQALARNDTFYNHFLFLTASPGLGKSHLSQAVGNYLGQNMPQERVRYLTAENFANDMVRSLRNGQMTQFKERYRRECEILIVEEVQFLSGKDKIQAEFCYTLETLMSRKKRVVFTSCYLPGEISQISQELRSRLTGGIITPIGPPDFSTRVNILAQKADLRGLQVPMTILEYLAEYVSEDVRRLESAVDGLAARATLLHQPINLRLAEEVLQDLQAVEPRLQVPDIQKIVGDYYRVSLPELLGRGRQKKLVRARQMALYFCRLYTRKTLTELGRLFQRSHGSVSHAIQTLERDCKIQPRVAQELQLLEEKMAQAQVRREWQKASTLRTDA